LQPVAVAAAALRSQHRLHALGAAGEFWLSDGCFAVQGAVAVVQAGPAVGGGPCEGRSETAGRPLAKLGWRHGTVGLAARAAARWQEVRTSLA
jgi:hypothetical protein